MKRRLAKAHLEELLFRSVLAFPNASSTATPPVARTQLLRPTCAPWHWQPGTLLPPTRNGGSDPLRPLPSQEESQPLPRNTLPTLPCPTMR